jgi:hypothetical protein
MRRAGLRVDACRDVGDIWDPPSDWRRRIDAVEAELQRRYGDEREWQVAERQSNLIAQLLEESLIEPQVFSLLRAD